MLGRRHHPETVDPAWEAAAAAALRRWRHLDDDAVERLLDQAHTFDRTRFWEGLDGLAVTPAMRGTIAALACLPAAAVGLGVLGDVTAVLVAPTTQVRSARHRVGGSIVSESEACVLGEAMLHGPVRLAWDQVAGELRSDARTSVVLHEFAHKIDMSDGVSDGAPPIRDRSSGVEFERVASTTLTELRSGVVDDVLRTYAATNRSELFAVATEAFFLRPRALHERHPALFGVLAGFYRQLPVVAGEPDDPPERGG